MRDNCRDYVSGTVVHAPNATDSIYKHYGEGGLENDIRQGGLNKVSDKPYTDAVTGGANAIRAKIARGKDPYTSGERFYDANPGGVPYH